MNTNKFEGDAMEALLRQLGACETSEVSSMLYSIKFKLDGDLKVSYVFNVNWKSEYYLQRVEPYPISHGTFATEVEVVDFITKDINKFRNAQKSSNFPKFLEVTEKVTRITDRMEELFLNYNVNGEDLLTFNKELDDLVGNMSDIESNAKKL